MLFSHSNFLIINEWILGQAGLRANNPHPPTKIERIGHVLVPFPIPENALLPKNKDFRCI